MPIDYNHSSLLMTTVLHDVNLYFLGDSTYQTGLLKDSTEVFQLVGNFGNIGSR
jgi:hypothetical protein